MLEYPNSLAAEGIMKIANKVINDELWTEEDNYLSLSRFIGRFKSFWLDWERIEIGLRSLLDIGTKLEIHCVKKIYISQVEDFWITI